MSVLRFRDQDGNVQEILAIRGEKGDKGEKGDPGEQIHTDADGAVLEDVFVKRNPVYRATPDTLADIISKADAGATVQLLAGAYPRLDLVGAKAYPEGLTIVGDEGVTMAGVSMTSGLAKPESGTDINPQMHVPSNLTFKGVTFTDSFCLRNCVIDGLNILDCSITAGNIRLSPDSLVDKYGRDTTSTAATVWQWNSAKPHIRNVVIDGNVIVNADGETDSDKSAIIVSCVDNLEVSNNEIKYVAFNGIQVNGQSNHYSTGKLAIAHNLIRKSGSRSLRIANLKSAKLFVFYNDLRYANQVEENGEVVKVSGCVDTEIAWSLSSTSGGNTYRADDDGVALHYISVGDGITIENDYPAPETAAPRGYGLGGFPERTLRYIEELDDLTGNGWYNLVSEFSAEGTPNRMFYLCGMEFPMASVIVGTVTSAGTEYKEYAGVWQEVRPLDNNAVIRRKQGYGGLWGEWEVENPPMEPDVEYRTTERSEGRVVYAKRISHTITTPIENTTECITMGIEHRISNFDSIIRCSATKDNIYILPMVHSGNGGTVTISHCSDTYLFIRNWKYSMDAGTIVFDLYYTKTA